METKSLENSIRIIDFLSNLDEEYRQGLIEELSQPDLDIKKIFIEPFSTELNKNLMEKESYDGLKIVIRNYIDAFKRLVPFISMTQNTIPEQEEILDRLNEFGIHSILEHHDLSNYSKYVILSYHIYNCHFFDIQTCCLKYNLDFFEFCRDIHFSYGLIDTSVTRDHRNTEYLIQTGDSSQNLNEVMIEIRPDQDTTNTEKFKTILFKYGFFELPMVNPLNNESKEKLFDLLNSKKIPYCVAMFDHLGFFKFLEKEYFQSNYKLNIEISSWFKADKKGRLIKGNRNTLLSKTNENKDRYTAHLHKEKAEKDFQSLI